VNTDPLRLLTLERGYFLRREALALGVGDGPLRRGVRSRQLVKVRHGAYTFRDLWQAATAIERHAVLSRAVLHVHEHRVALTHHSAVVLHGIDHWRLPLDQVHVTRLDGGSGRDAGDVKHHVGKVEPDDLVRVAGLPMVSPVRAAVESATILDAERALVVLDSGLRQGLFDRAELTDQAALLESWPGSLGLHVVARLADGRSGSVGESRSRYLFWCAGLPAPQLQYEVYDEHGLVGVCDFAWPEHGLLGEFDGQVKYGALLRPGETASDAVFREKQREDRLRRATGWSVVRLTWDMLATPERTAAYLRAMLLQAA
jgi:hypothetical protein